MDNKLVAPAQNGPLEGMRVLDLAHGLAGPFASTLLADFGAEVVKIERPGAGDIMRQWDYAGGVWWKSISRGKRSIAIDLSHPDSARVVRDLVVESDVLIESFRPGVLERLGFAPDVLLEWNPDLIILRISGYGQTGPNREWPGYGKAAEAYGGLLHMTGFPDGPPTFVGFPIADMSSGLMGAFGVLLACIASAKGLAKGQVIDLALYETILRLMDYVVPMASGSSIQLTRNGNRQPMSFAPAGVFKTLDDRWVLFSAASAPIVRRVLTVVAGPEAAARSDFDSLQSIRRCVDEIDDLVGRWCAQRTGADVVTRFTEAGAVAALVRTPKEIVTDPHLLARGSIVPIGSDGTLFVNAMPPLKGTPGKIRFSGPPVVGADGRTILRDVLGYTEDEIEKLSASHAVEMPSAIRANPEADPTVPVRID